MALAISKADLAVELRIIADPAAAIPAAYDAMLTRRMEQAENRIEGYAPGAPPSAKSEAAVRWIGYAMDTPASSAGTAFADAFRHSGAMAELAPFRNIVHHDLDTPETGLRPSVHVLQVVGGLSADATPVASELTILPTTPGIVPFPAFIDMHVLIWRPRADGPINSVIFDDDPTRTNQITGFAVSPVDITVGHLVGSVWVSNQLLTFTTSRNAEVR